MGIFPDAKQSQADCRDLCRVLARHFGSGSKIIAGMILFGLLLRTFVKFNGFYSIVKCDSSIKIRLLHFSKFSV